MGDIVLTFPVIKAIKKHDPNSHITFAVKEQFQEILYENDEIDEIIPLTPFHQQGIKSLFAYINKLNEKNFDLVIDLHRNLRSRIITLFVNANKKIHYRKHHLHRKMMMLLKRIPEKKVHTVDNYLRTIETIGITWEKRVPQIEPDASSLNYVEKYLKQKNLLDEENLIAINPNAAHFTKQLPAEKIVELTKILVEQKNAKVILIGGEADHEHNQKIIESTQLKKNIISTAGEISLKFLPALLSRCKLLITNDSGPMHVAVSVGTPVVAFFGPTIQEFGFYPLGERDIVIEADVSCRPCSLHGTETCPKSHFKCMKTISIEKILLSVEEIISFNS